MASIHPLSGMAYLDANGLPYASAKLYAYVTGSTTPQDTYTSAALSSANTNPVVAGTDGVFGAIYLPAKRFKFVLKTSADVQIESWDPFDPSETIVTASSAPSPTYPFLVWIDTSTAPAHRKVRASDDLSWVDQGPVDALINAATVTQQLAGTSAVVSSTPDSVAGLWQRGSAITPSAGAISLPSTGGGIFDINAGNFSSISSASGGRVIVFEFAGASTITHNASSLDLPGNANITTATGDRAAFVNLAAADATGSNWRMLWFEREDGSWPFVVATQAQLEAATNNTFPVTAGRMQYHPGTEKARVQYDQSSTTATVQGTSYNVSSVTDGATGIATPNLTTAMSSAFYHIAGITQRPNTNNDAVVAIQNGSAPATNSFILATTVAAVNVDMSWVSVLVNGDQ